MMLDFTLFSSMVDVRCEAQSDLVHLVICTTSGLHWDHALHFHTTDQVMLDQEDLFFTDNYRSKPSAKKHNSFKNIL